MLSKIQVQHFFAQGNYTQVALLADPSSWQKYAALALIGKTSEAIAYFESHRHSLNATFYAGVAHWLRGNDGVACQLLEQVPTAHAQNLLRLIQQQKITVLAQVPWIRNHFTDWLVSVDNDPKFQVKNISFHPDDSPNSPYADIHQFYDVQRPPDFYFCQMVEWHLIPPNLQELSCPIFGQTADYDLHIQAVYPWLQLFDELLVTDGTEWDEVSKLVSVPVSTFPKTFCLPRTLPALELKPRPIDLYLSGTVTHPYHPDKAHLLSQILRVPELEISIVNGFTSIAEYYENLSNAKVCFTYVRHSGATPTRGLEALSLGCGLVTQAKSTLTLFVGEQQGVRTYSYDQDDLTANLVQIARNWPDYQWKAHEGAKIIRREFSAQNVASQLLRYLTFLAAKPTVTQQRRIVEQSRLVQKRTVLQKGWLPCYDFQQSLILKDIGEKNVSRLDELESKGVLSPEVAIDKAREIILLNYHRAAQKILSDCWLKEVIKIYEDAIATFPNSLVLRFNFLRLLVHFGNPAQVSQAIDSATKITHESPKHWSVDCQEDVLPYDVFSDCFNYRAYFDSLLKDLGRTQHKQEDKRIQLILASIHYYLGLYTQDLTHFWAAIELDPSFAKYGLSYVKKEIKAGANLKQNLTLINILAKLAQGSTEFLQADKIIDEQILAKNICRSQFSEAKIQPICTSVKDIEGHSSAGLRPSIEILTYPWQYREFLKTLILGHIANLRDSLKGQIRELMHQALDVPEYDLVPFIPSAEITTEAVRQRIHAMQSSKFLFISHRLNSMKVQKLDDLDVEGLIGKVRELERTRAWQLRIRWLKLKLRLKQHLIRLKNFYIYRSSGVYAADPTLISSTQCYNLLAWRRQYYGIPKFLGQISLHQADLDNSDVILVETSLQKLQQRIKSLQRSIMLKSIDREIKPYHLSRDASPKILCERITLMQSSKFLMFETNTLDLSPYDEESNVFSIDTLRDEICRLEKTPAWRVRMTWLHLKRIVLQIM